MNFKLTSSDPNISWKLQKNPTTVFERELRDNTKVTAWWEHDVFCGKVEHDIELLLTHCKKTNMTSYNAAEFWVAGPYNLIAYDEVFRSVLRNKFDASLTQEQCAEAYEHSILIGPVSEYNQERIEKLTAGFGLKVMRNMLQPHFTACYLHISANMPIDEFLQKVYIFLSAYQAEFTLGLSSNDKLAKYQRFFENWIETVENKEYLLDVLSNRRAYKVKLLDESIGLAKEERIEQRQSESLHALRHQAISKLVDEVSPEIVLDAACGSGQLISKLNLEERQYIGFDASDKVYKIKRRGDNITAFMTNIMFPYMPNYDRTKNTVMILSEVIEHFNTADRRNLYGLIDGFYQPDYLIVTTPNAAYNHNFGFTAGQMRHKDHKIEFDPQSITEINDGLNNYRLIKFVTITDAELEEQPSFIILYQRIANKTNVTQHIRFMNLLYAFDDRTNKSINRGLCHRAVVSNIDNIFYLGPTIAPSEGNETQLESLEAAKQYYNERGVDSVYYQEKVMGSRAYVLWFNNLDTAQRHGFSAPLIINSRNGFQFFNDEELMFNLWNELNNMIGSHTNMIMLDCEVTPWVLKSGRLIDREFTIPLETEYLHLMWFNDTGQRFENVAKALASLETYIANEPIKIHVFDVLSIGNKNVLNENMLDTLAHLMLLFESSNPMYFTVVKTTFNADIIEEATKNSEGVVVKPLQRGEGILPAMKVRNQEYLRLIYGAHYLEYLSLLQQRSTNKKRKQSHNQFLLSNNMVNAFVENDTFKLLQSIGLFYDNDTGVMQDRTL